MPGVVQSVQASSSSLEQLVQRPSGPTASPMPAPCHSHPSPSTPAPSRRTPAGHARRTAPTHSQPAGQESRGNQLGWGLADAHCALFCCYRARPGKNTPSQKPAQMTRHGRPSFTKLFRRLVAVFGAPNRAKQHASSKFLLLFPSRGNRPMPAPAPSAGTGERLQSHDRLLRTLDASLK